MQKSTLLSNLAAVYFNMKTEFTILTTIPGVITYKGAKTQVLDLPVINEVDKNGKSKGSHCRGLSV